MNKRVNKIHPCKVHPCNGNTVWSYRKKGSMLHAITWMSLENFIISKDTSHKGHIFDNFMCVKCLD